MDYQTILKEQEAREQRILHIQQGSPTDLKHVDLCLDTVRNEPDDLVRIYARIWLESNALIFAQALLKK